MLASDPVPKVKRKKSCVFKVNGQNGGSLKAA